MKAMIATLFLLLCSDLFANEARRYQGLGQILFERNHLSCEIQNNIDLTGRVHKIVYDMRCRDHRYPGYFERSVVHRCGEDYENCDVEAYDFEIFDGPRYRRSCREVVAARCRFTYSFPEDDVDDPDMPGDDPDSKIITMGK